MNGDYEEDQGRNYIQIHDTESSSPMQKTRGDVPQYSENRVNKVETEESPSKRSPNLESILKSVKNPFQSKQLADLEEKIDDFLGYTVLTWVLWIFHLFNLGYFLFEVLIEYSQHDLQDYIAGGIIWNVLHIIIYWEAFKAKDDLNVTRQKIFLYGILLCYMIFSASMVASLGGKLFYVDCLYYGSTGIAYLPILNSGKMNYLYGTVLLVEALLPGYLAWTGLKIKALLEVRTNVFKVIESQRASLIKSQLQNSGA